jgi:hypothetical protein
VKRLLQNLFGLGLALCCAAPGEERAFAKAAGALDTGERHLRERGGSRHDGGASGDASRMSSSVQLASVNRW